MERQIGGELQIRRPAEVELRLEAVVGLAQLRHVVGHVQLDQRRCGRRATSAEGATLGTIAFDEGSSGSGRGRLGSILLNARVGATNVLARP
eukprot:1187010-Prorocentrum_minimum.AAC.1